MLFPLISKQHSIGSRAFLESDDVGLDGGFEEDEPVDHCTQDGEEDLQAMR